VTLVKQLEEEEDDLRYVLLFNTLKQLQAQAARTVLKEKERLHGRVEAEMTHLYNRIMN
jgi:hypothetical protein